MGLKEIRHFFRPGGVVWVDYWKHYDLVLAFTIYKNGCWEVTVQECDVEGKPFGRVRRHSTTPCIYDRMGTYARIKGVDITDVVQERGELSNV